MDGVFSFASYVDGVEFEALSIPGIHPSVQGVELSASSEGDLKLKITVANAVNQEGAKTIAVGEANRIIDRLAFQLGKSVSNPRFCDASLIENVVTDSGTETKEHALIQVIALQDVCTSVNTLGETSLNSLRDALSQPEGPGESAYYGLFRAAIGATDPASKYLGLYQILALLNEDKQAKIDKFILGLGKVATTKTYPKERKGKVEFVKETIYTRLRNEYVHDRRKLYRICWHERSNVTTAGIRAEMASNLGGLISLVQTAIKKV